ncbi:MAG: hypothetical protein QW838_04410 [Candidatus Nitrosotenuis sp.]
MPTKAVKKPAGAVMLDGKQFGDTLRCVHCSAHWVVQPGSGKRRGFCIKCKGPLCGSPLCVDTCIPLEARLAGWEKGLSKREVLREIDRLPKTITLQAKSLE